MYLTHILPHNFPLLAHQFTVLLFGGRGHACCSCMQCALCSAVPCVPCMCADAVRWADRLCLRGAILSGLNMVCGRMFPCTTETRKIVQAKRYKTQHATHNTVNTPSIQQWLIRRRRIVIMVLKIKQQKRKKQKCYLLYLCWRYSVSGGHQHLFVVCVRAHECICERMNDICVRLRVHVYKYVVCCCSNNHSGTALMFSWCLQAL